MKAINNLPYILIESRLGVVMPEAGRGSDQRPYRPVMMSRSDVGKKKYVIVNIGSARITNLSAAYGYFRLSFLDCGQTVLPAILKGWIDRVYACGFAYGVGAHGGARWGDRYGEGTLMGKRAMLAVTLGGREPHYTDRGVNGRLFDVLWPIQHGILFYPGMSVLPPFALYQADRFNDAHWVEARESFQVRLKDFFTELPIAFRTQNGGDYDEQQVLRQGLGSDRDGLMVHLAR